MRSNCFDCCEDAEGTGSEVFESALESVGLLRLAHLFPLRHTHARHMLQGVFLAAVDGEVVVPAHAGVHKFQVDVFADAFQIAVVPDLEGVGRRFAAAFIHGSLVGTPRGVGIGRIGLAEGDIHVAAIRLPARLAGGEMLVGVGDAAIMLFAKLVFRGVGIGIAAQPELLDEGFSFLIVAQVLERPPFIIADDVAHILFKPGLVGPLQLVSESVLGGKFFLVGALALERIRVILRLAGHRSWPGRSGLRPAGR